MSILIVQKKRHVYTIVNKLYAELVVAASWAALSFCGWRSEPGRPTRPHLACRCLLPPSAHRPAPAGSAVVARTLGAQPASADRSTAGSGPRKPSSSWGNAKESRRRQKAAARAHQLRLQKPSVDAKHARTRAPASRRRLYTAIRGRSRGHRKGEAARWIGGYFTAEGSLQSTEPVCTLQLQGGRFW